MPSPLATDSREVAAAIRSSFGARIGTQLAQARPAGTGAVSLYSPPDGAWTRLEELWIANNSGASTNISLFHDDNGTTYSQNTALIYTFVLATKAYLRIPLMVYMATPSGNFAIQTSVGNAASFTLYGSEVLGA